jgi:amino acid adenylation domain-containing protein/non-ribosomal peptide synthase protein (TIGR01720 family)
LAAFQALLHRHTGQADLAVGTPVANRSWPELEGLIGFFVNTAVLRQRLNGRVGFHELLAETRETVLDALAHQEAPFERLVAELRPERDPAFQPLAQVAFAYQNVPHHEPRPPGLRLERLRVGTGSSKFDLSLVVSDASDALRVVLEYDSDLFDRTTATRFADGYARLLAAALRDPDLPLTELEVLTPAQRHLVRAEWNDSRSSWPNEPATVVEMVDRAVRRYPSRTAVSLGRQRLDYRQLDDLAEQIADALADRGVGAGHRVAVLLRRSPVLVAAQLAVMRTGAAYVPLDPSAPPRRLRDLLTDAAAVAVVAEADLLAPLAGNHPLTLLLPLAGHRSRHRRAPRRPPDPAQAAYLIFTSGSTGRPRGVEISHGSLRNLVLWHRETYGVGTDDRASLLAGLAFDATVWETWPYLTAGASLHLPAERVRTEPRALRRWLARTGITMAFLPTPLAEAVMAAGDTAEAAPRLLHTGGDRLHARPPAGARFTLVNHYGPTETTVVATAGVVPSEPAGSLPDIGRPIANLEVHVVDAGLYTVPIGVAGELLVGGVGLALGYSGLPRQTAEHFVPDPFVARPGGRLYRTGDFVRHRADGRLDFLGRLDDQIQLHGVRIEPGEVESALAEHPRIAAAAVAAQETGPGRVQLTGFFVARGEAPGEEELRDFLAHRLPATLVPVRFVQLDALPLTANGKVDRRRLPRPALTVASPSRPLPDDPPLRRLAEIWCSVLSLEAVGLDDDFFRLGGDSLSMIEMIARARRAGLAITAEQVMRDRTIARLAPRFGEVAPPPAAAGRVGPEPPLTPIQHWFFEHDLGDRDHWNVSVVLAVPGDLSTSHLRTALSVLVAHHDSLRLRFTRRNGSWQQRVVPASSVAVSELDGRRIGNAAAARLLQRAGACIQTSLSIENGPLLRAFHLRRREPGADRVLLVVHHLAADGISLGVLIRDLETVYGQLAAAVEPRLQEVPTSFARWAHSLRDHVESPSLRSQVAYWTSRPWHLATPLPSRDNGGGRRRGEARAERVRSGVERTRDLLGAASELGCDVSDLALAAAVLALARASGGRRLLVALVQHGRIPVAEGLALDRTVGWFSSIFPVLFELPDRASADAVLTQVRRRLAEVPEGGIGYGLLRYAVGDPGVRRIPHHQVSFNYLGRLGQASSRPGTFVPTGESAGPLYSPRGSRPSELAIFVSLGRDGLDTRWIYGRDQLPRRTVLRLTTTYERALAELARSKGERNDEC